RGRRRAVVGGPQILRLAVAVRWVSTGYARRRDGCVRARRRIGAAGIGRSTWPVSYTILQCAAQLQGREIRKFLCRTRALMPSSCILAALAPFRAGRGASCWGGRRQKDAGYRTIHQLDQTLPRFFFPSYRSFSQLIIPNCGVLVARMER